MAMITYERGREIDRERERERDRDIDLCLGGGAIRHPEEKHKIK
jgi:hypothetical protein